MLDEIVSLLPEKHVDEKEDDSIKIALIGKPNVGKSSLINRIIGSNRNIRKKSKINERIEEFSIIRSKLAIERADICMLVVNAEEGATEQDTKILRNST